MRSVDGAIDDPESPAERLHRLHRDLRRLRIGIDLWSKLVPAKDRDVVRSFARRLKRLARLVGEVRDRDVVLDLYGRVAPLPSTPGATQRFHRFLARLTDDARTGRELLRASLRTERDASLFGLLASTLDRRPSPHAAANLQRLLSEERRTRHRRVRRAHRRATRRPSADRLHQLRIRLRQLRHVAELSQVVDPGSGPRVPLPFRRLQDRLGRLHDLDIALATLDPALGRTPWAEELRTIRRGVRRDARRALERLAALPAVATPPRRRIPGGAA